MCIRDRQCGVAGIVRAFTPGGKIVLKCTAGVPAPLHGHFKGAGRGSRLARRPCTSRTPRAASSRASRPHPRPLAPRSTCRVPCKASQSLRRSLTTEALRPRGPRKAGRHPEGPKAYPPPRPPRARAFFHPVRTPTGVVVPRSRPARLAAKHGRGLPTPAPPCTVDAPHVRAATLAHPCRPDAPSARPGAHLYRCTPLPVQRLVRQVHERASPQPLREAATRAALRP